MAKSFGYIGNVVSITTNRLLVFRVLCLDHDIANGVFDMFALVIITGLCYISGGMGLIMALLDNDFPISIEQSIILLIVGVLFHAASQALDYLKEIRDAVQKMAADKE